MNEQVVKWVSNTKSQSNFDKKIKITFINPPIRWNQMTPPLAYISIKSYYKHYGKYNDNVQWQTMPYKWDKYTRLEEVYEECKGCDVYLFSSYIWNYDFCDKLAQIIREKEPNAILLLGGPHIGKNEKDHIEFRKTLYDFILSPTQPGEIFFCDFLNSYFDNAGQVHIEDLSWEIRSNKTCNQFLPDYSVYEENKDMLKEMHEYAKQNNITFEIAFETTRGCPFKCTFCEWGGGIGSTKIIKKPIDTVKRDLDVISEIGFLAVELCDANVGAFAERDLEIVKYAYSVNVLISGISLLKDKNFERRKKFINDYIDIIVNSHFYKSNLNIKEFDIFPLYSIQTLSSDALTNAKRTDMSAENKLKISNFINDKMEKNNLGTIYADMILGMPGSTLQDFYDEYEIYWKQKNFNGSRYIYMILPDTENSEPEYLKKHGIELVKVYSDFYNDANMVKTNSVYYNRKVEFFTVAKCNTITKEEMCEMWVMNFLGNLFLLNYYHDFEDDFTPPEFIKKCWNFIKTTSYFEHIWCYVNNLLDNKTSPKNVYKLLGKENFYFISVFNRNDFYEYFERTKVKHSNV